MEDTTKMQLMGVFDEATEIDDEAWKKLIARLAPPSRFTRSSAEEKPWIRFTEVVEGSLIEPVTDPTKLLE